MKYKTPNYALYNPTAVTRSKLVFATFIFLFFSRNIRKKFLLATSVYKWRLGGSERTLMIGAKNQNTSEKSWHWIEGTIGDFFTLRNLPESLRPARTSTTANIIMFCYRVLRTAGLLVLRWRRLVCLLGYEKTVIARIFSRFFGKKLARWTRQKLARHRTRAGVCPPAIASTRRPNSSSTSRRKSRTADSTRKGRRSRAVLAFWNGFLRANRVNGTAARKAFWWPSSKVETNGIAVGNFQDNSFRRSIKSRYARIRVIRGFFFFLIFINITIFIMYNNHD